MAQKTRPLSVCDLNSEHDYSRVKNRGRATRLEAIGPRAPEHTRPVKSQLRPRVEPQEKRLDQSGSLQNSSTRLTLDTDGKGYKQLSDERATAETRQTHGCSGPFGDAQFYYRPNGEAANAAELDGPTPTEANLHDSGFIVISDSESDSDSSCYIIDSDKSGSDSDCESETNGSISDTDTISINMSDSDASSSNSDNDSETSDSDFASDQTWESLFEQDFEIADDPSLGLELEPDFEAPAFTQIPTEPDAGVAGVTEILNVPDLEAALDPFVELPIVPDFDLVVAQGEDPDPEIRLEPILDFDVPEGAHLNLAIELDLSDFEDSADDASETETNGVAG